MYATPTPETQTVILLQMYWCNPVSYGLKALAANEFLAPRWDKPLLAAQAAQVRIGNRSALLICLSAVCGSPA